MVPACFDCIHDGGQLLNSKIGQGEPLLNRTDDHYRYIEYLQQQMLAEDWAPFFDSAQRTNWIATNRERLQKLVEFSTGPREQSLIEQLEQSYSQFQPTTQFELPTTQSIFGPIFDLVKRAADSLGIRPVREIELATSTTTNASPMARPTETDHLLFVGPGTSSFCNYWAKAYTAIIRSIPYAIGFKRLTNIAELHSAFVQNPQGLILASRLAIHYALYGTLLRFGEVLQGKDQLAYRLQLLQAMEIFAVAHEYSHFVAEERIPQFSGVLDSEQSYRLEDFCDELGIVLSRECANTENNLLAFTGIGALVFFRAIQLCERVRQLVIESSLATIPNLHVQSQSDSHPPLEDRIVAIKSHVADKTASDQRAEATAFMEEYDLILSGTSEIIIEMLQFIVAQRP